MILRQALPLLDIDHVRSYHELSDERERMAEVRIKKLDENEIDTILAEDIDYQGVLSFEEPLMIKGKFSGEIKASGDLYVGQDALVEATIEANRVSARGEIRGDMIARSGVELFATAKVTGDIVTPNLEIEKGCRFNGRCRMEEPPAGGETD